MNLISCDNCATVLDQDKLHFPKDIYRYNYKGESETIDELKAAYNQSTGHYAAFVLCPSCNEKIFQQ